MKRIEVTVSYGCYDSYAEYNENSMELHSNKKHSKFQVGGNVRI